MEYSCYDSAYTCRQAGPTDVGPLGLRSEFDVLSRYAAQKRLKEGRGRVNAPPPAQPLITAGPRPDQRLRGPLTPGFRGGIGRRMTFGRNAIWVVCSFLCC